MNVYIWMQMFCVGSGFCFVDFDLDSKLGYDYGKFQGQVDFVVGFDDFNGLQEWLFVESCVGMVKDFVLLVLQVMDFVGKGGIVCYVVGGVDLQGVVFVVFKVLMVEECEYDFLWCVEKWFLEFGFIGVFDCLYYEDVLIGWVRQFVVLEEIECCYDVINEFEVWVVVFGMCIIKVMLYIFLEEQKECFMECLEWLDKYWKYNFGDVDEWMLWLQYMQVYQMVFDCILIEVVFWYVILVNVKWYVCFVVQELLFVVLEDIDLQWFGVDFDVEVEKRWFVVS